MKFYYQYFWHTFFCWIKHWLGVIFIECSNNFFGLQGVPLLKLFRFTNSEWLRVLTWEFWHWWPWLQDSLGRGPTETGSGPRISCTPQSYTGAPPVYTPQARARCSGPSAGTLSWFPYWSQPWKINLNKVYHREIIKFQFPFSLW